MGASLRAPLLLAGLLWLVGGLFVVGFARHEQQAVNPILDLRLLCTTPFLAANLYKDSRRPSLRAGGA